MYCKKSKYMRTLLVRLNGLDVETPTGAVLHHQQRSLAGFARLRVSAPAGLSDLDHATLDNPYPRRPKLL